ncbi:hypothetical protein BC834DRAFT_625158 [Gloeopeniophorella convolvens]|nr:hypothetical protein BC834DRAFT_625158 [Gloeopeniophorella convolvens]
MELVSQDLWRASFGGHAGVRIAARCALNFYPQRRKDAETTAYGQSQCNCRVAVCIWVPVVASHLPPPTFYGKSVDSRQRSTTDFPSGLLWVPPWASQSQHPGSRSRRQRRGHIHPHETIQSRLLNCWYGRSYPISPRARLPQPGAWVCRVCGQRGTAIAPCDSPCPRSPSLTSDIVVVGIGRGSLAPGKTDIHVTAEITEERV